MVYREHTCYLIKYSYLAEENKKGLNSTYTKRHIAGNRIKLRSNLLILNSAFIFHKIKTEGTFTLGEDVDSGSQR